MCLAEYSPETWGVAKDKAEPTRESGSGVGRSGYWRRQAPSIASTELPNWLKRTETAN